MSDRGIEDGSLANAMRPDHWMIGPHRRSARIVCGLVGDRQDVKSGFRAGVVLERVPLVANRTLPHSGQPLGDGALGVLDANRSQLLRRVARELRADQRLGIPAPLVTRIASRAVRA